ncbi:hypothetical protein ES689_14370 [Frigoribacterium sp. ACAM 257]|uniref:hypothetical protein n=1 Tax=Frigoribacterium sp. ACAM 257 TaxID=2508998 RepID=UPI0011BA362A|nr:hypothetical protein [Frigoribacterium sp. ACAM 257]TWX35023.1 hypothetical protein ES689_14370 [Frigoribacterium sp. ACAM 257]
MTHAPDEPQQPAEAVSPEAPEQPVVEPEQAGGAAAAATGEAGGADGTASDDEVTVRRAPKIFAFLLMGGALGVLASLLLTSLFPFDPGTSPASTYGYFSLWGLTFGAAFGAVVAIVVDRVSIRRAKTLRAERRRVDAPEPPAVEGELE